MQKRSHRDGMRMKLDIEKRLREKQCMYVFRWKSKKEKDVFRSKRERHK